jgi:hypothetical protein
MLTAPPISTYSKPNSDDAKHRGWEPGQTSYDVLSSELARHMLLSARYDGPGGEATCLGASSSFLLQEWGYGGRGPDLGLAPAIRAEL